MSRSSSSNDRTAGSRAQTEPLGALVAIAAVCLAVTLYAGYVTEAVPGFTERNPADAALEQVWGELGPTGVYDQPRTSLVAHFRQPPEALEMGPLPEGYFVSVAVSVVGPSGEEETIGRVVIDPDGTPLRSIHPPASAQSANRLIAVQRTADPRGTIRIGTLTVEVWT